MDKRLNYYISKNNVFTWLSVVMLVISLTARCIFQSKSPLAGAGFWWLFILPLAATALLIFIILIRGNSHFYKSAIPMWMFAVYFGMQASLNTTSIPWIVLIWAVYLAFAFIYLRTVSGKERTGLCIAGVIIYLGVKSYSGRMRFLLPNTETVLPAVPDLSLGAGILFMLFAVGIYLDNEFHPTWGDRTDGRRLRTLDPITIVANYIMPSRNGASNSIHDRVEISEIEKYIVEKRKEGYKGFGITHIFLAAYVRAVAKYPAINRFLSGQQVYSRGDDIQFCMVVKTSMETDAPETVMKLHLKPTDTIFDIYEKMNEEIKRIKKNESEGSSFDKVAKLFSLIPGLLFKFTVWFLKLLDYFGLMPRIILEVSPFHGSIFFTSMASLGIEPIVHHLYDFGNLPVFCSFGSKYVEYEPDPNVLVGVNRKKYIDYTFNTDERICDGFYYATVFKYVKRFLNDPVRLEVPPEEVKRDIE